MGKNAKCHCAVQGLSQGRSGSPKLGTVHACAFSLKITVLTGQNRVSIMARPLPILVGDHRSDKETTRTRPRMSHAPSPGEASYAVSFQAGGCTAQGFWNLVARETMWTPANVVSPWHAYPRCGPLEADIIAETRDSHFLEWQRPATKSQKSKIICIRIFDNLTSRRPIFCTAYLLSLFTCLMETVIGTGAFKRSCLCRPHSSSAGRLGKMFDAFHGYQRLPRPRSWERG